MYLDDLKARIEELEKDEKLSSKFITCQVVGTEGGAWNLTFKLTRPLNCPFPVLTASHPDLKYLPLNMSEPMVLQECVHGHKFVTLPDHPLIKSTFACPHCLVSHLNK